ncbi:MAG: molecular chaperone, partial [Gemmatimonadota bacterium]
MIRKEFVYVFICLLFLLPNEVMAGSFTVHPIKVFVEPEKKTATLIVTNNGEEVVAIQVEGIVWRQDEGGKDTFEPTQDIIFFPKIFSVGPKEERVVRIGYNGQWPVTEKTYRLFLRELPVSKPGETALKMALRI